jgi:PAS domain S-box-containing protein
MRIELQNKGNASKATAALNADDKLRNLAFDNTAQANIITVVSSGKIVMVNSAASKLLGYSKKELLAKNRSAIFNIKERSFKKNAAAKNSAG